MRFLAGFETFIAMMRLALLVLGGVAVAVCAVDWAVRTRRVSPFSAIARFFRRRVDPLFQPIERIIVRAGGVPTNAPWWGLVAFAVIGILLISLLQFAYGIAMQATFAASQPETIPRLIVSWIFAILRLALFVRVISTWFPVSPYSRWIRWSYVLTDWLVRPISRMVPRVGMFDISPIVAYIVLLIVEGIVNSLWR